MSASAFLAEHSAELKALPLSELALLLTSIEATYQERRAEELGALLPKPSAAPKKAAAPKTAARKTVALPASADAPKAEEYRMDPGDIDSTTCIARILAGNEDKRWSPAVYSESQCGKPVEDGCDLCSRCKERLEKYTADPRSMPHWNGTLAEEPLPTTHMLGTVWAASRNPKWHG